MNEHSGSPVTACRSTVEDWGQPSAAYRRHTWMAVAGLLAFLALYLALAGWFVRTAYRLTWGGGWGQEAFWGWLAGLGAALLAVFMIKALFFVKRGSLGKQVELKATDQPALFAFLHDIADQAGAPRPHRVFVSAEVNAAVFYDLTLLNLLLPSRKNLVIGLGLVQALNLGEFRAVLAHEFGHFAQRAMAVGRWVYVAQQIAAHLVARRDALDSLLQALSRTDPRIAWVGWLLSLIIWSIRSLVESAYRALDLGQRALSREMELNADLVAVALTGSDALVHALYRLQAADEAWGRTLSFALNEKAQGRVPPDFFTLQQQCLELVATLYGDPQHGKVPPLPPEPEAHRLFKVDLAQPPRMWLTHPLNHEREANAKRRYLPAALDETPVWSLFANAPALRTQVTALLLDSADQPTVPPEESLAALRERFDREPLRARYRGAYLGRSPVRHSREPAQLWQTITAEAATTALGSLYPPTLADELQQLRQLQTEQEQLQALVDGRAQAASATIRFRDRDLRPQDLNDTLAELGDDLKALRERLRLHDLQCRSVHLALARTLGQGWPELLLGRLNALHYGSHAEANLRDLQSQLHHTLNRVTAGGRVGAKGRREVLEAGSRLHRVMRDLDEHADALRLDAELAEQMGAQTWREALGPLSLPSVSDANLGDWLKAVDSWVDQQAQACGSLRHHALDLLLLTEQRMATWSQDGTEPNPAPEATAVPGLVETLLDGEERPRNLRLSAWARFQTADGWPAATARLLVAGGIVASVLGFSAQAVRAPLTLHNGLSVPLVVKLPDQAPIALAPGQQHHTKVPAQQNMSIRTERTDGELVEAFEAQVEGAYHHHIYNVAGASSLVEWTATYGNAAERAPRRRGAPRWLTTEAEHVFEAPPTSVSIKGGGATRNVIDAAPIDSIGAQLNALQSPDQAAGLVNAHARFDDAKAARTLQWWQLRQQYPGAQTALAERLKREPHEATWLRLEQDLAASGTEREGVCTRQRALAASAPHIPDLAYVVVRCQPEGDAKSAAFLAGAQRNPKHGWFAYAAGATLAEQGRWPEARSAWWTASERHAGLAEVLGPDLARLERWQLAPQGAELHGVMNSLQAQSESLRQLLAPERAGPQSPIWDRAHAALLDGNLIAAQQLMTSENAISQAHLLRRLAVSDGAPQQWAAKALALPADVGLNESTLWAMVALALRQGQDPQPWQAPLLNLIEAQYPDGNSARVTQFLALLRAGRTNADLEAALQGMPLTVRAYAMSLTLVVKGSRAPIAWRSAVPRLLFASERPYFNPG